MLRRDLFFIYESSSGEAWVNIDSSLCSSQPLIHTGGSGGLICAFRCGGRGEGKSLDVGPDAGGLF